MKYFAFIAALFFATVSGCATEGRALQLRKSIRIQGMGTWQERWNEASTGGLQSATNRLKLCLDYVEQAQPLESTGVPRQEIDAACTRDARALSVDETGPAGAYALAARWASEVLHDTALFHAVNCSGVKSQPDNVELHSTCAEHLLSTGRWQAASPLLIRVFEKGTPNQKCEVIRKIDQFSPAASVDTAKLPADEVRRCRVQNATQPVAEVAKPLPAVPTQRASPQIEAQGPIEGGFELHGTFGAVNTSAFSAMEFGYGSAQFSLTFVPSLTIAGPSAAAGLGVAGRIYFAERRPGLVIGYVRPEATLGFAALGQGSAALNFSLGAGAGAEYLFTPSVGVSVDLSVRAVLVPAIAAGTIASVGIVLHP